MVSQGLGGLVGQGMGGRKPASFTAYATNFSPGSYTFIVPYTGRWTFAGWSGASPADGFNGAGPGALWVLTRPLAAGMQIPITVGAVAGGTTIALPFGVAATATAGSTPGAAGVATGGDVNLNGSDTVGNAGSAAPSYGQFRGGSAVSGAGVPGKGPGGGSGTSAAGGSGQVIAVYLGP